MEENTNSEKKLSIIDHIIGDREKWKKLPNAFRELGEDMKTKKAVYLITVFCVSLCIVYLSMSCLRWVENNSQYCDVLVEESYLGAVSRNEYAPNYISEIDMKYNIEVAEQEALPIPKSNMSWAYYLKYYKDGRKQPWVGFNCSWDFKRAYKEHIIQSRWK